MAGEEIRLDARPARQPAGQGPAPARAHPRQARHGVPELQSLVAHDHPREHHRGADPRPEGAAQGGGRARRAAAAQGRHLPAARRLSGAHLGRPAAARGDRPGAGDGADRDAVRRADLGARSRARGRGAEGDARPRRRGPHHARRHPRDGLRPRRRQRGGVPASGPDRGAGRAARRCSPTPPTERFRQFLSGFTKQEQGAAA